MSILIRIWGLFVPCFLLLFSSAEVLAGDVQTCQTVTYPSSKSAVYDIVFVFDKPYRCGQFANGDVWVTPYPDATLTITSITPASGQGLHGFEINPSSKTKQGFDKRIPGYDATLTPKLPLSLSGVDSVVKAVSVPESSTTCRPCLEQAAVLTVMTKPVPASETVFRPGYFGKTKVILGTANITSKSLSKVPVSCCSEAAKISFAQIRARYQRVQLDHLENYVVRFMHPLENMPDYGADISLTNSIYLIRMLMSDFSLSNADSKAALIGYLQMAIDLRSMAENGATWPANGGHGNGRKLPILFAGWLLDDLGFQKAAGLSSFSEDTQVYLSPVTKVPLYGRDCGADYAAWKSTITGSGSSDCRDPYGLIDGGGWEIGQSYQYCCTAKPWKYTTLAVYLLGLQASWKNDTLFKYVERWVSSGAVAQPDKCAPYNGVALDYGKAYGPGGTGGCLAGPGRWPAKHGINKDAGLYSSLFGEQVWSWYKTPK